MPWLDFCMEIWRTLKGLVQERLDTVADREHYLRDPEGHLERLKSVSERLDAAVQVLPPDTDPQLRHFLERQSYMKALDFLNQEIVSP